MKCPSVWCVAIEREEARLAAEEFSCHFAGTGTMYSFVDEVNHDLKSPNPAHHKLHGL